MTDQELIELVQATPAEDLSLEQIDALRQALPAVSPALREALLERLQMEQYLGHALGRIEVSVDRIFEQAEAVPAGSPTARLLYWGLALVLLVSAGLGLYYVNRDRPAADPPIARSSAPPATPQVETITGERSSRSWPTPQRPAMLLRRHSD